VGCMTGNRPNTAVPTVSKATTRDTPRDVSLAHTHGVGAVHLSCTFSDGHDQHQFTGACTEVDVCLRCGVGVLADEVFAQYRTSHVGDVHLEGIALGRQCIHLHDRAVGDHFVPACLFELRHG